MGYIVYKQGVMQGGLDIEDGQIQYLPTPEMASMDMAGSQIDGLRRLVESMRDSGQSDTDLYESLPARLRGFVYVVEHEGGNSTKGGPGSGNFDHVGRPGLVGGSGDGNGPVDIEEVSRELNPDLIHRLIYKSFDMDEYEDAKEGEDYDWRYHFTYEEAGQQKHRVVSALYKAMNAEAGIDVSHIDYLSVKGYNDFMYDLREIENIDLVLNADKLKENGSYQKIEAARHPEAKQGREERSARLKSEFLAKYPKAAAIFEQAENPGYVSYEEVNEAVHVWAVSSNDNHLPSLQFQKIAGEEFGVPLTKWQQTRYDEKMKDRREGNVISYQETANNLMFERRYSEYWSSGAYPLEGEYRSEEESNRLTRMFVRKMYENTQARLQEVAPDTIRLYRGVGSEEPIEIGTAYNLVHNPLESWTTQDMTAKDFAQGAAHRGQKGYMFVIDVPKERLFATPATGIGSLAEFEVVLINAPESKDVGYAVYEVASGDS